MMQIPVSEAFQGGRQEVSFELDSDQIQWLKAKAEEHDVSPDQVVRYLINAQIRGDESLPTDLHHTAPPEDASPAGASGPEEDTEKQSSILEDLRDASNMLNDLTSDDESPSSEPGADRPDPSSGRVRSRPPTGAELSASDPDAQPDASPRRSRPTDFFPDDLPGDENGAADDEPEEASEEPESMFNMVDDDADDETDDGA